MEALHYRDCSLKAATWVFAEYQLDFVLSDSTLNPEKLSDNWRHMKAVWSVVGVRTGFSAQQPAECERLGAVTAR